LLAARRLALDGLELLLFGGPALLQPERLAPCAFGDVGARRGGGHAARLVLGVKRGLLPALARIPDAAVARDGVEAGQGGGGVERFQQFGRVLAGGGGVRDIGGVARLVQRLDLLLKPNEPFQPIRARGHVSVLSWWEGSRRRTATAACRCRNRAGS